MSSFLQNEKFMMRSIMRHDEEKEELSNISIADKFIFVAIYEGDLTLVDLREIFLKLKFILVENFSTRVVPPPILCSELFIALYFISSFPFSSFRRVMQ